MSLRLVHLADAHLGAPLANFGDHAGRRRAEQEEAFRRAIGVALEERAQIVVVAGDLFDTFRPEPSTVNLVRRELGRLREAGIKTFGVPGTHDSLAYPECVYRTGSLPFHHLFSDPSFESPATLEVEGIPVTIYGIAYDPDRSRGGWDSLVRRGEDGVHVAVAHAACRFNPDWPIGDEDLPFEEADLAGLGMDYVALGHYHNLRLFDDDGRVVGAYSGSIEGRDWTETGPRHVLVVEWDGPGSPSTVRPVEVQSRVLEAREVDVTGLAEQEAIAAAVEAACDPERLWRVTLVGEPEVVPDPDHVVAALPAHDHVRVEDGTSLVASHRLTERVEEETVRGEFFRRLVERRGTAADERERRVADRAIKIGLRIFG